MEACSIVTAYDIITTCYCNVILLEAGSIVTAYCTITAWGHAVLLLQCNTYYWRQAVLLLHIILSRHGGIHAVL